MNNTGEAMGIIDDGITMEIGVIIVPLLTFFMYICVKMAA